MINHEAFDGLSEDASMVDILGKIAEYCHCEIVINQGAFFFVPNQHNPDANYTSIMCKLAQDMINRRLVNDTN